MPDGGAEEAALTADLNAEMIGHRARFRGLRDRSIFVGNPADVVADAFGPGLPAIREWTEGEFDFAGYVTGFDAAVPDVEGLRARLGYHPDEKVCVVSVGGSGVGLPLLRRVLDAVPLARQSVPELRFVIVTGPRIDPASLPSIAGAEVHGFLPDLTDHLAACDVALTQGGLTTCMELTALRKPFLYVPLQHHFEQNFHVRHRLEQYRAGTCVDYGLATDPDALAAMLVKELGRDVDYRAVETDGAARAAALLPTSSDAGTHNERSGEGGEVQHRLEAMRHRSHRRRRREHLHGVAVSAHRSAPALESERSQRLPCPQTRSALGVQHNGPARQLTEGGTPELAVGCPVDPTTGPQPFVRQPTVEFRCSQRLVGTRRSGHGIAIRGIRVTSAFTTRSVTGSQSHCLVEEEERRPAVRAGQVHPPPLELEQAGDPQQVGLVMANDVLVVVDDAAAVAREQPAGGVRHQVTPRVDPVATWHRRARLLLDVGAQLVALGLQVGDAVLDHVADADDRFQLPIDDHGDVADAELGHGVLEGTELVLGGTRRHLARHDRRHGPAQHVSTELLEMTHDVTLADDSVDALTVVAHDDGADAMFGEQVEEVGDTGVGAHRDDGVSLALHDIGDPHVPTVVVRACPRQTYAITLRSRCGETGE